MNIEQIISTLTPEEKIALCEGADYWHTESLKDIPSIMLSDGPHGLRKQAGKEDMLGLNQSVPATCFPTAVTTASSWDPGLLEEIGRAIGREALHNEVSVLLGPGVNLKRNPLCGRNFEYFSEDPLLAGKLAAGFIRGVEGTGISACLKHFAANSQEFMRTASDSVMDERTLRELYLTAFEIAVKEGKPASLMCAYNKLNGVYCSDHKELLTDILRTEWGFDGTVITDWGALNDRAAAFRAGCDLNMPGGSLFGQAEALRAIRSGDLEEERIDDSLRRILKLVEWGAALPSYQADYEAHHDLARRTAAEGAVLLKNDGGLLPLAENMDILFLGDMAGNMRYQGAGSSRINPTKLTSPRDACPHIPWLPGCLPDGSTTPELLAQAKEGAKQAKNAVLFVGLTHLYESEGIDRSHMKLPQGQINLIEAVSSVNPNTVVVLFCGSPVETEWADKVSALLWMGLPGQAGGGAAADLLFGRVNPCGKLAESWPMVYEDCVSAPYYGKTRDAHYREGLYAGYRWYDSAGLPVRYPFGYGLSYTSFAYSDLKASETEVTCTVTNTGSRFGKEIVQLYIAPPKGEFYRPQQELRGFCKVALEPGESKTIAIPLTERSFALWNAGWVIPGGEYTLLAGPGSRNLPLRGNLTLPETALPAPALPQWYYEPKGTPSHSDFEGLVGHSVVERKAAKGSFTMSDTTAETKELSSVMKLLHFAAKKVAAQHYGGKPDENDPQYRMVVGSAGDNTLNNLKINGRMKNHLIEGMVEIANGHPLRGLGLMLKRVN